MDHIGSSQLEVIDLEVHRPKRIWTDSNTRGKGREVDEELLHTLDVPLLTLQAYARTLKI